MPEHKKKETACRKSPWRFVFAAAALVSGGWLIFYGILQWYGSMLLNSISYGEAATIGIIGGADGPTAIFVAAQTGYPDWDVTLAAVILMGSILAYCRLCRGRKK